MEPGLAVPPRGLKVRTGEDSVKPKPSTKGDLVTFSHSIATDWYNAIPPATEALRPVGGASWNQRSLRRALYSVLTPDTQVIL